MYKWQQLSPSVPHALALGPAFGMTDIGLRRHGNEDNFLIDSGLGLVLLGDGMGGHAGGDIASATALLTLRASLGAWQVGVPDATVAHDCGPALAALSDAVAAANAALYQDNVAHGAGDGAGMGTTLTGMWLRPDSGLLLVVHVGDSRLYRHRDGQLALLTRDQTLYQQALESTLLDHAPENLPNRNLLLQAVGPSPQVQPDISAHAYRQGDLYLLCSDGLHGAAPHGVIDATLAGAGALGLERTCAELIEQAKLHGSSDNITAVLLRCETAPDL